MNHEQAERLRNNPAHWKFGLIYSCSNDPRVIVRNLWRIGWTWNFSHPYVFVVLPIVVLVFLAPVLFIAPMIDASAGELVAMYVVTILAITGVAHFIAEGPR